MGLEEVNVLCSCFLLFVSAALKVRCDSLMGDLTECPLVSMKWCVGCSIVS